MFTRVQKLIAQYGYASRRSAEKFIKSGRVRVNGELITELGVRVPDSSIIEIDGRVINRKIEQIYLMLHKPEGYICARRDPLGRQLIYDLIERSIRNKGIFSVGRLDFMSEGLLLLTNDGDFAQKILHPASGLVKRYEVLTRKKIPYKSIAAWKNGIYINGIKYTVDDVTPISEKKVIISLIEGKNREIRKLFENEGIRLKSLRRVSIGTIELGNLPKGSYRKLTSLEVKNLTEEAEI
jgi:23S rRNA pseudouridine2605 synthase